MKILNLCGPNVLQGNEPWKTAFNDLKKQTSLNFVPCPIAFVSEDAYGVNSFGGKEFYQSAMAAYKHSFGMVYNKRPSIR